MNGNFIKKALVFFPSKGKGVKSAIARIFFIALLSPLFLFSNPLTQGKAYAAGWPAGSGCGDPSLGGVCGDSNGNCPSEKPIGGADHNCLGQVCCHKGCGDAGLGICAIQFSGCPNNGWSQTQDGICPSNF